MFLNIVYLTIIDFINLIIKNTYLKLFYLIIINTKMKHLQKPFFIEKNISNLGFNDYEYIKCLTYNQFGYLILENMTLNNKEKEFIKEHAIEANNSNLYHFYNSKITNINILINLCSNWNYHNIKLIKNNIENLNYDCWKQLVKINNQDCINFCKQNIEYISKYNLFPEFVKIIDDINIIKKYAKNELYPQDKFDMLLANPNYHIFEYYLNNEFYKTSISDISNKDNSDNSFVCLNTNPLIIAKVIEYLTTLPENNKKDYYKLLCENPCDIAVDFILNNMQTFDKPFYWVHLCRNTNMKIIELINKNINKLTIQMSIHNLCNNPNALPVIKRLNFDVLDVFSVFLLSRNKNHEIQRYIVNKINLNNYNIEKIVISLIPNQYAYHLILDHIKRINKYDTWAYFIKSQPYAINIIANYNYIMMKNNMYDFYRELTQTVFNPQRIERMAKIHGMQCLEYMEYYD